MSGVAASASRAVMRGVGAAGGSWLLRGAAVAGMHAVRTVLYHRRGVRTMSRTLPAALAGTLKVRIPTSVKLDVYPQTSEAWDHCDVFVDVEGDGVTEEHASAISTQFGLQIIHDTRRNALRLETAATRDVPSSPHWFGAHGTRLMDLIHLRGPSSLFKTAARAPVRLTAYVPSNFNIDIETFGGSVHLHDTFEGKETIVFSTGADVYVDHLNCTYIAMETRTGAIHAQSLNGNTLLRSREGSVAVMRLQGNTTRCHVDSGAIDISSLYSQYSFLRSVHGDISIGTAMGDTSVRTGKGQITILGQSGRLDAESSAGDIALQLSEPGDVYVRCYEGSVKMGLTPSLTADLDLEGDVIDIDQNFQFHSHLRTRDHTLMGILTGSRTAPPRKLDWKSNIFVRCPRGKVRVYPQVWGMLMASKQHEEAIQDITTRRTEVAGRRDRSRAVEEATKLHEQQES
ncbi:hypothetical protein FVE85_0221 [Porphyridium purpureum]|uniref:DUF4097 domain-containing protein n=1 Tax=Porphyridium purpureum TaxID=35688 RepID=A0A5J4Z0A0_PORPP|nr:hypothetical protein FVE85_0221 [Porphyridium purpureum]|eukprot:POR0256..scf208_2